MRRVYKLELMSQAGYAQWQLQVIKKSIKNHPGRAMPSVAVTGNLQSLARKAQQMRTRDSLFLCRTCIQKAAKKSSHKKKEICRNCRIYSSPKQSKRLKSLLGLPKKDAGSQIAGYKNCQIYPTIINNYISDNAFRKHLHGNHSHLFLPPAFSFLNCRQ